MLRHRDESRWEFTRHQSVDDFLKTKPHAGAHSIAHAGQHLDMLIEDRGSDATLVLFHSALTSNIRTLPVLQGGSVAADAGLNLVSVSDPSLAMGDVDLAWFIGNRTVGHLRPLLSPLIQHALTSLDATRTILFGSSGGGYAAVDFAQDFPGCIVLAVNPRLNLSARPHPRMAEYLQTCHGVHSRTPMFRVRGEFVTENVADTIQGGLSYDLLLFQNTGDSVYLNNQAAPFIRAMRGDPRLYVRMEHTGEGHTGIPPQTLRGIIDSLATSQPQAEAIREAGFNAI